MSKSLLLVIDMQKAMEIEPAYNINSVKKNIKTLLEKYRREGLPVVYVQHEGKEGSVIARSAKGWPIIEDIAPIEDETIVNKRFNSGFKDTNLEEVLNSYNPEEVVITGMQSEYCIDTTVRVAFEKGYNIIVPRETNTTFDTELLTGKEIYEHHNAIWDGRFARVVDMKEIV